MTVGRDGPGRVRARDVKNDGLVRIGICNGNDGRTVEHHASDRNVSMAGPAGVLEIGKVDIIACRNSGNLAAKNQGAMWSNGCVNLERTGAAWQERDSLAVIMANKVQGCATGDLEGARSTDIIVDHECAARAGNFQCAVIGDRPPADLRGAAIG